MDNLLPTITVLMAEASVVLLILLGFLSWRYLRRKRQHEAELETLIAMAQGREVTLPPATTAKPATTPSGSGQESASPGIEAEKEADQTEAQSPLAADEQAPAVESIQQPVSPTVADQSEIMARLAEIRHAQELMDGKLNQLRHDHQKLAASIFRALEKTGKEMAAGRHEIDRTHQLLNELRKRITALPTLLAAPLSAIHLPQAQATKSGPASAAPEAPPSPPATTSPVEADSSPAMALDTGEIQGLDPQDPDLVLDQETLERLAEPVSRPPGNGGIAVEEISLDNLDPQDIHEAIGGKSSLFSTPTQVFFQSSTQDMAQGWYFSVDGGPPQGPFSDKLTAELVMEEVTGSAPLRRELG
jgi:hypothetical protein